MLERNMTTTAFLIIGVSDGDFPDNATQSVQTSLVGIATSEAEAERLVSQDYIDLINNCGRTPINSPIRKTILEGDASSSYVTNGYTWHVQQLALNSLVNFTL